MSVILYRCSPGRFLVELWEIHPALVHFPIAFLLGAVVLELYAWWRGEPGWDRVVTGLFLAGVATAALAAVAGVLAFFTGPASFTDEAGRLVWWHIGAAVTQFVLFAIVAFVRWRHLHIPAPAWTRLIGLIAALVLLLAGYVGGHLVYHGATGIEPQLLSPELREKQTRKEQKASPRQTSSPSVEGSLLPQQFHR
jgi:uncharacterized membrane protein